MKKGFTLIELLVVVLIIGILASIALPQYTKAVEKSRATEAIQLLGNLANAEWIYYMQNSSFTNDLSVLDIALPGVSSTTTTTSNSKNFQIVVQSANNATTFVASAARANNGTPVASGDSQYAIMVEMSDSGVMTRWCDTTAATTKPASFSTSNKACRAISNNASGEIK